MSNIVAKAFDATQKIMRAIFRGSPNLFTTSDLNRQVEAFDYRLKRLEWYRDLETDMDVFDAGTEIRFAGTYLRIFGCTLAQYSSRTSFGNLSVSGGNWNNIYLYLVTDTITYSDDSGHTISGAKFVDGTSQPAADHIQIVSWGFCSDGYGTSPAAIVHRPTDYLVNNGSMGLSSSIPNGAILIPLLSRKDEDGYTAKRQLFVRDSAKDLVTLANNFFPKKADIRDTNSDFYIGPGDITEAGGALFGDVTWNKWFGDFHLEFRFDDSSESDHYDMVATTGFFDLPDDFPLSISMFPRVVPMGIRVYMTSDDTTITPVSAWGYCGIITVDNRHAFQVRFRVGYASGAGHSFRIMCYAQFTAFRGTSKGQGYLNL